MGTRINIVGGFTIDAVLDADDGWTTDRLGGNALWACAGLRVLGDGEPAAHSIVGADYPADALARIAASGIDVGGVRRDASTRTARVTFAYRADGSRTQPAPADRVATLPAEIQPAFADTTRDPAITLASLPAAAAVRAHRPVAGGAWHLGLLPAARFVSLVPGLRAGGVAYLQADCPARFELHRDGDAVLREHLASLDVFLPSTSDTDVFAPGVDHRHVVDRFHDYGAPAVVMKRGADGALVSDAREGTAWIVPAYPVGDDGDATGAGDVFCGIFAGARVGGATLAESAIRASAGASFALSATSPLDLIAPPPDELARRVTTIRNGVTQL